MKKKTIVLLGCLARLLLTGTVGAQRASIYERGRFTVMMGSSSADKDIHLRGVFTITE